MIIVLRLQSSSSVSRTKLESIGNQLINSGLNSLAIVSFVAYQCEKRRNMLPLVDEEGAWTLKGTGRNCGNEGKRIAGH